MSAAKHTPGSVAALAEAARMMPWEKGVTDVPLSARWAFQQAITADHYLELLEALEWVVNSTADEATDRRGVMVNMPEALRRARAAIAKATGAQA